MVDKMVEAGIGEAVELGATELRLEAAQGTK